MHDDFRKHFLDLNMFRGVGEDPVYHPPVLTDRPRAWPLDRWIDAPRDLGFDEFPHYHWRGLRLLKEPQTQSAYHDLLWELRPRTIIELGVYSGGSLIWFRDLTKLMGINCQVFGMDKNLAQCQIPPLKCRTSCSMKPTVLWWNLSSLSCETSNTEPHNSRLLRVSLTHAPFTLMNSRKPCN